MRRIGEYHRVFKTWFVGRLQEAYDVFLLAVVDFWNWLGAVVG